MQRERSRTTSDLISRQALKDALWNERRRLQMLDNTQDADKIMRGLFLAEQIIQKAKAVEAVPVVRCKDCKHRTELCGDGWYPCTDMAVNNNWYCADGERREECMSAGKENNTNDI